MPESKADERKKWFLAEYQAYLLESEGRLVPLDELHREYEAAQAARADETESDILNTKRGKGGA